MKKLILSLLLVGWATQMFSQITKLSEVAITVNYKYLNAVNTEDLAESVNTLHEEVAFYDIKTSELYSDEYDEYFVTFFIPEGKILAAYDKDGFLIRTVEKFKNIKLPMAIIETIAQKYPKWHMAKDIYKVNYHKDNGVTKMQYKVRLENGKKSFNIKIDEDGNFM
jgi:predicted nucleic acid-binding protein